MKPTSLLCIATTILFTAQINHIASQSMTTPKSYTSKPYAFAPAMEATEKYFQKNKGGYKPFKRMEEYMISRLGPNGEVVNAAAKNLKAYNNYTRAQKNRSMITTAHNGNWQFVGPTATTWSNVQGLGRVNRIAFHPTDPNILYASTAGGGVWKTDNKGLDWHPLSDGIPVMCTTGIAVDTDDPDIIYVLTGDGDSQDEFKRTSIGVLKSMDGGATWDTTGLSFDDTTLVKACNLYMDPEDNLTLYACTDQGLFRTHDGAQTWDTIRSGLIYELEFKPGNSQRIYVVDDDYCYVSDDGGDTWIDSTFIPPIDGKNGRMTITTSADNPEILYLLASPVDTLAENDSIPDHRGIWRSENSGEDFQLMEMRPNLMAGSSGLEFKSQAWYDFAIESNPLNFEDLFVGSIGMWYSNNQGAEWYSDDGINLKYHADIHDVEFNPIDNYLYLCTDGGIFMSADLGVSYVFRSINLCVTQYYRMNNSPFDADKLITGSQDNGVHVRWDDDSEFNRTVWGDGIMGLFHETYSDMVVATCEQGKVYLSDNGGESFENLLGKPSGDTATWSTLVALDAYDPDVIYVGYHPIMKSIDHGETFFQTSHDTISAHRILVNNHSNPAYIYAGDCKNCGGSNLIFEMYLSTDAGDSWEKIDDNPGFPDTSLVTDAAISPGVASEVWITCGGYEEDNKVFRSVDAGATWTNESEGLPNVPLNAIVFQNTGFNPTGAVYAATDIGVFYRDDDLGEWVYFSNGLPCVEISDLDIDYIGQRLRASTYGRGIWETPLYGSCINQITLDTNNQQTGLSYVHQATNKISSAAHVDGIGSTVIYRCQSKIFLTTGFHATSLHGAKFWGVLGPCDDNGFSFPWGNEEGWED